MFRSNFDPFVLVLPSHFERLARWISWKDAGYGSRSMFFVWYRTLSFFSLALFVIVPFCIFPLSAAFSPPHVPIRMASHEGWFLAFGQWDTRTVRTQLSRPAVLTHSFHWSLRIPKNPLWTFILLSRCGFWRWRPTKGVPIYFCTTLLT